MNKIAYSLFIAFVASIATLFLVHSLGSSSGQATAATSARVITLDELSQHSTAESCWKEIGGRVYDITAYIPNHPSTLEELVAWCGKPASEAFSGDAAGHSHSAGAARMLASMQVGVLEGATVVALPEPNLVSAAPRVPVSVGGAVRYQDGTYYAEGEPDGRGWFGVVEITVYGGQIVGVHYDEVQRNEDGAITQSKARDYGYAARWRNASGVSQLSAYPGYIAGLLSTGDVDQVDVFTGATSAHTVFQTVVSAALAEASAAGHLVQEGGARGGYRDGSYYAETQPDSRGWIGMLEITINGGYVVSAHYDEVQRNAEGAVTNSKLRDYGYAGRWRAAAGISQLSAYPGYIQQLVKTGDAEQLDAYSGATSSYNNVKNLAEQLLQDAR
ncbi:cytochrome b5 domain-containing protein [Salinispirillum marinum]|uniref:Cytochrome b5 domain-containing protein n=2 Tax=Saccharospirillaceae TaxID=255527 RepID=A0ABV8BCI1_9GAMM